MRNKPYVFRSQSVVTVCGAAESSPYDSYKERFAGVRHFRANASSGRAVLSGMRVALSSTRHDQNWKGKSNGVATEPSDGSAQNAPNKLKSEAADVANKVKSDTAELAEDVKRRGEQQLDSQKQAAADQAKSIAGVVERAAEELREQNQQSLAEYAGQLAGSMKSFADSLKSRSTDDLIRDTQQLARKNPTLFVLGSVAATCGSSGNAVELDAC